MDFPVFPGFFMLWFLLFSMLIWSGWSTVSNTLLTDTCDPICCLSPAAAALLQGLLCYPKRAHLCLYPGWKEKKGLAGALVQHETKVTTLWWPLTKWPCLSASDQGALGRAASLGAGPQVQRMTPGWEKSEQLLCVLWLAGSVSSPLQGFQAWLPPQPSSKWTSNWNLSLSRFLSPFIVLS